MRLFGEVAPFQVFGAFAGVEGGDGAMVTHDAGPDLAAGTFFVLELDVLVVKGHDVSPLISVKVMAKSFIFWGVAGPPHDS